VDWNAVLVTGSDDNYVWLSSFCISYASVLLSVVCMFSFFSVYVLLNYCAGNNNKLISM
jgi:hypothetical protein